MAYSARAGDTELSVPVGTIPFAVFVAEIRKDFHPASREAALSRPVDTRSDPRVRRSRPVNLPGENLARLYARRAQQNARRRSIVIARVTKERPPLRPPRMRKGRTCRGRFWDRNRHRRPETTFLVDLTEKPLEQYAVGNYVQWYNTRNGRWYLTVR